MNMNRSKLQVEYCRVFFFIFALLAPAFLAGSILAQSKTLNEVKVAEGFNVKSIYSVPESQGSWVSLTVDEKGRLIASDQYGKLYRISNVTDHGGKLNVEPIEVKIGRAQGLLVAFDSLYVMAHGGDGQPSGLYRVKDSDGDDQYDNVELLRQIDGGGEHGPHTILLSPDKKSLYVCAGNHTKLPDLEKSRVPRNWQEDQVLPRMWDARGHAVGILAPGGWICKTDPDGKQFELISSGYRNEYDMAFDANGELFTYDADMEWDIGTPWYRPTRVCHVTSGSEFGWRSGTGKWPTFYPDSLPPVVDIGPGSPTGVTFGTGTKFPAKYQNAMYLADWSYGVIYAVHMTPNGATYQGESEWFCSAPAMQVADMVVNPVDGSLYFVIGGRRTESGLYRVTYNGDQSTEPTKPAGVNAAVQQRRDLEKLHSQDSPAQLQQAIGALQHDDRFVRYAARIAIEHQPVEQWQEFVFTETQPQARLELALALARNGNDSQRTKLADSLGSLDWSKLSEMQQLALVRIYGLILARSDKQNESTLTAINQHLSEHFPANSAALNRELSRLLIATKADNIVARTINVLQSAPTQEEQIHYVLCLRVANQGWTEDLRREYFQWFLDSAVLNGGLSFSGFLANIRKEAIESMDNETKQSLRTLLAQRPERKDPYADLKSRPFVRNWTVEDLIGDVQQGTDGCDIENGKKMFVLAQCYKCHSIAGEGGYIGPDLTPVARRYTDHDLLETIIDPSKAVSDQYQATRFLLMDGRTVSGRVINLNGDTYTVLTDMLDPSQTTSIKVGDIDEMAPATKSLMPDGLLDTLTKEDVKDLVAYLRTAGKKE
jgi:putative heme-binding domain-containing protein